MSKQSVRGFGIAIFLIGALIYSLNSLNIALPGTDLDADAQKEIDALKEELATAKSALEDAPPAEEATKEEDADADESTDATTEEDEEKEADDVVEATISVVRGNSAYDISRKLEDADIIDNALQFELFLANGEYSKRIQIGEFTVTSDMSEEEIAEVLTTP